MPQFKHKQPGVTELGTTVGGKRYRFVFPYTTDNLAEIAILLEHDCVAVTRAEAHKELPPKEGDA